MAANLYPEVPFDCAEQRLLIVLMVSQQYLDDHITEKNALIIQRNQHWDAIKANATSTDVNPQLIVDCLEASKLLTQQIAELDRRICDRRMIEFSYMNLIVGTSKLIVDTVAAAQKARNTHEEYNWNGIARIPRRLDDALVAQIVAELGQVPYEMF